MNSIFYKVIIGVQIIFYFGSCSGQSVVDDCESAMKNAKSELNTYYKSNDLALLNSALHYTEQSMFCKETRLQAVELKTSLLILLKRYKAGYEFTDSLGQNDFNKGYKKAMNYNFFKALEYETNGDTVSAHKSYLEAMNHISQSIETNKASQVDQDAYYDLFLMKSKVLSPSQLEDELEALIKKYPANKDFFTILKTSFSPK